MDVAGAGLVVDNTDREEEGCLEQGVSHHERHSRVDGVRSSPRNHQGQEAQLRDGTVGQNQLEVGLFEGGPAAEHHGEGAEDNQDILPDLNLPVAGSQAQQNVDTGLDHRCRVQVGRDRGGGGHSAG